MIQREATLLLASVVLIGCGLPALAQADSSIDTFWARFRIAVINGDKRRVSQMTQFPLTMPYGVPVIRTSSQLLTRYKQVFNAEADATKCFTSAKPRKDPRRPKEFTVGCDNGSGQEVIIYRFVLTKVGWRFKSLDNINE